MTSNVGFKLITNKKTGNQILLASSRYNKIKTAPYFMFRWNKVITAIKYINEGQNIILLLLQVDARTEKVCIF